MPKANTGLIEPYLRIVGSAERLEPPTHPPGLVPRLEIRLNRIEPSVTKRILGFLTHVIAPTAPFVIVFGLAQWALGIEEYKLVGTILSSLMLLIIPIIIGYSLSRKKR